ncbi:MAG: hypothetical protein ACC647_10955 [Anaerolineales bacterium]
MAGKRYLVVGGVNFRQEIVLKPRRISLEKWPAWARANLLPTDAVVLEATTNAWEIYDQVAPLPGKTVVAHPPQVKWIAEARVKTDRLDVLRLAHLLAADLIPEVWVPPVEVRELRALMAHRRRLPAPACLSSPGCPGTGGPDGHPSPQSAAQPAPSLQP